jgi:3-methylcrotonyl-CoA carboxylase alpha subunit
VFHEFTCGGKTLTVELRRDGDGYTAEVNGRTHRIDVQPAGPGALSILVDGRSVLAHAAKGDGAWYVSVRGETYELLVPGSDASHAGGGADEPELEGGVLKTPMPGRVVSVEVEAGQAVEPGQALLVLESMKMQNTIVSPAAGKIVKIHRAPGELASFGDPLVEIDVAG